MKNPIPVLILQIDDWKEVLGMNDDLLTADVSYSSSRPFDGADFGAADAHGAGDTHGRLHGPLCAAPTP